MDDGPQAEIRKLEGEVAECRKKIARYREALESGTDASLVMEWLAEVTAAQSVAEGKLREAKARKSESLSQEDVRSALDELRGLVGLLDTGDPKQRAAFYEALGLKACLRPKGENRQRHAGNAWS